MKLALPMTAFACTALWLVCGIAQAQPDAPAAVEASPVEAKLENAAADGKYVFLLFYKQKDAATQAMATTLKAEQAEHKEISTATYVLADDPAEQRLVAKYDVSRAPLPLLVAVAPNGAMTGIFSRKLPPGELANAFVTPTMMFTMKSLQEGKLVLVTVNGSVPVDLPEAVTAFQEDPHFNERLATVSMSAADPQETKFVDQMQIDADVLTTQTVLLAPPGVMVGKFKADATKDYIAAELAKAGKCCDDPNCKHHKPAPRSANQAPATKK